MNKEEKKKEEDDPIKKAEKYIYEIETHEKKILETNAFRLNELHFEFGSKFKRSNPATRNDNSDEPNQNANDDYFNPRDQLYSVEGLLDYENKFYGIVSDIDVKPGIAKLQGQNQYLFNNFPFKSKWFSYRIMGVLRGDQFYCRDVTYAPVPFTLDVAAYFLRVLGMDENDFLMCNVDWDNMTKKSQMESAESTLTIEMLCDHIFDEKVPYDTKRKATRWKEFKRYFLHNVISKLGFKKISVHADGNNQTEYPPVYNEEQLVSMDFHHLRELYDVACENPHVLAFTDICKFSFKPSKEMIEGDSNLMTGYIPLPELSFDNVSYLCNILFKDTSKTKPHHMCAVKMYQLLKEDMFDGKHTYTHQTDLKQRVVTREFSHQMFEDGLKFLSDNELIIVTLDYCVFLRYSYYWEKCISTSFKILFQRDARELEILNPHGKKRTTPDPRIQEDGFMMITKEAIECAKTFAGHPLSKEQKQSVTNFSKHAVCMTNGRPGSGKSGLLEFIATCVDHSKILGTAFQSVHLMGMARDLPGRVFTAHAVLYIHDLTCKNSPHYDDSKDGKELDERLVKKDSENENGDQQEETFTKKASKLFSKMGYEFDVCPLENIEILICEEFSTWDVALASKLLSAVISCGKLRKVSLLFFLF